MIFTNQVVAVTGAGAGIGKATALRFAETGAVLALLDKDEKAVKRTAEEVEVFGGKACAFEVDVLDYNRICAVIANTVNKYGRVDVWCNCAGVSTMGHVWDISEEEWDFNMDVNAKGVFLCTKAVLKPMLKQRYGRVINIASIASLQADPLLSHYCASKWAVLGFSKTAAYEVGKYGITINCVCPSTVCTDMQSREMIWSAELQGISRQEVVKQWIAATPAGRLVEADDVAELVLFLARKENAMINGAAIPVTGGSDLA